MNLDQVSVHLEEATSTIDLATRVGRFWLREANRLESIADNPAIRPMVDDLEARFRRVAPQLATSGGDGGFAHVLKLESIADRLERVRSEPGVGHIALLRALLPTLRRIYDETGGSIELQRGTPVSIVSRAVNSLFRSTPHPSAGHRRDLLGDPSFYLFDAAADNRVRILLDFQVRGEIDDLTWTAERRLPRIATLHPRLGRDGVAFSTPTETSFFDVRPRHWDKQHILDLLRSAAARAKIAVLPELSLTEPGALEEDLANAEPGEFPPLIVAGSAHRRFQENGREIRTNESRIYLEGREVSSHRKIVPFELRHDLEGNRVKPSRFEALSTEPKSLVILSGNYTRLAVLICSDLLDASLTQRLVAAGVNLLLVPSLTPDTGSFNGGVCTLASHNQAVSVIPNADRTVFRGASPFQLMAAVPRPRSRQQSREYRRLRKGPAGAVIDPNKKLWRAVRWF